MNIHKRDCRKVIPFSIFTMAMEVDNKYGERILGQTKWHNALCPKCNKEKLKFTVIGSYRHWMSIPLHPIEKEVSIKCESCGHNIKDANTLNESAPLVRALEEGTKYPWRWYGRLYLIGIITLFTALTPLFQKLATDDYLEKPAKNDIYVIQDSTGSGESAYNFWKLYATGDVSVAFLKNAVDYDHIPDELDPDDGFFKSVFYVERSRLKQLQEDGIIKRIIRGYPRQSSFNQYLEVEN